MKLFRVSVEVELVVVAKDVYDAERQAESLVSVEDSGAEVWPIANEIKAARDLPPGWDSATIPFNSEGDKTIGEYLK